jgi:hypothetical protein
MAPLHASVVALAQGDTLILATDGIHSDFGNTVNLFDPPQDLADRILAKYGKTTDDALVLVARYLGRDA